METGGPGAVLGFQARSYPVFYHQQQSCRPVVLQKSYQGQCRSDRLVDNHTPQWTTTAAQRGGLGMRAVFLGSGNSQRKSSGTGVFLPRGVGNGAELKRKPGECSDLLCSVYWNCKCLVKLGFIFPCFWKCESKPRTQIL